MLDQLIESRSHRKDGKSLRLFFLGTATLVLTGCFSVFVWSIMAMELTLTDEGLELSTLVAPVPPAAVEPPKPEPKEAQPKQETTVKDKLPSRQVNMARVDEIQDPPTNISVTPNTQKARPNAPFTIGKIDTEGVSSGTGPERGTGPGGPQTETFDPRTIGGGDDKDDKPPVMSVKPPDVKKPVTIVHSSVINGKATSLPKPFYPPTALAVNAGGEVNVQVTLDEAGNVISAKAVSGHSLLRQPAEQAARNAKFSPTILNGQRVKVTGLIVYRFSRTG